MLFSLAVLRRSSRAAVVVSPMTSTRRRLKTRTYFMLQLLHLSPLRRRPQVAELAHSAGSSTHPALRRLSIAAQLSTTTFLTSCRRSVCGGRGGPEVSWFPGCHGCESIIKPENATNEGQKKNNLTKE
jgi:hypothetical protein